MLNNDFISLGHGFLFSVVTTVTHFLWVGPSKLHCWGKPLKMAFFLSCFRHPPQSLWFWDFCTPKCVFLLSGLQFLNSIEFSAGIGPLFCADFLLVSLWFLNNGPPLDSQLDCVWFLSPTMQDICPCMKLIQYEPCTCVLCMQSWSGLI